MEIQEFLQKFENGKYKIRVIYLDGEWLFFAKDVTKSLGYSNANDAIAKHVDPEDKKVVDLTSIAINDPISDAIYQSGWLAPVITLINESGLYSLILRSNLPEAKKFKRWITSEVLPAIRKYGYYVNPAAPKEFFSPFQKYNELKFLIETCKDDNLRDNLIKVAVCLLI